MKSIESAPPQQDYMFLLNSQVWKHGLGTIQPGIELSKLDEIIFLILHYSMEIKTRKSLRLNKKLKLKHFTVCRYPAEGK